MYQSKKVSVVLGTYREKRSIKKVVDSFFATGFVDEVVVVDNNALGNTREEVGKTKAKLITVFSSDEVTLVKGLATLSVLRPVFLWNYHKYPHQYGKS